MEQRSVGPVIVGVDGSPASAAAVELGTWEARRRHVPLLLAHGILHELPYVNYGLLPYPPLDHTVREEARAMLESVEHRTRSTHPGLTVRSTLVTGGGAGTLVELSRTASLVLVGARGTGGFAELRLGSVSAQVTMHSHAPVIVVRDREDVVGSGPVVVGVDGSPAGDVAIGFAFDEAMARSVPLLMVYAWWMHPLGNLGPVTPWQYEPGAAQAEAARMLAEATAGWRTKYPDVTVHELAVHHTNPAWGLIEASRDAGLLVVGSRGRGGFASLVLGSVSQSVITHADVPVAVVR
jgi:nucleotide-binding universal stress UspA family protein